MASGFLTKDAEFKEVGEKNSGLCKFSIVAMDKTENTETVFVNVIAWFDLAHHTKDLKKFDKILVCGTIKNADYTNKENKFIKKNELVADFITFYSKNETVESKTKESKKKAKPAADFFAIDDSLDDESLPF